MEEKLYGWQVGMTSTGVLVQFVQHAEEIILMNPFWGKWWKAAKAGTDPGSKAPQQLNPVDKQLCFNFNQHAVEMLISGQNQNMRASSKNC